MNSLAVIARRHKDWVGIAKFFGATTFAEDIVQDVYLRIHKYNYGKKIVSGDKINNYLMWAMIRNATHDQNKNNKNELLILDSFHDLAVDEFENEEFYSLERLHAKILKEILTWHWYDIKLFLTYLESDISMRQIAKEAKISLTSIFNTIKNCKERLVKNVGEDWQDYLNKDYELI